MAKPKVRMEAWPIVQIDFRKDASVAELEEHFTELLTLGRTHPTGALVAIVNITHLQASALARSHAAKGVDDVAAELGDRLLGIAYVSDSRVSRGLVTAIHWLVRRDLHTATFDTEAGALSWAHALLDERDSTPDAGSSL